MAKKEDIDDLLGDNGEAAAPKTKAKAKPAAAPAETAPKAPAKKAKAAPVEEVEETEKVARVREPVEFAEGEKEDLEKRVKKLVRKDINSKELAAKLEIPTRKLRQVLYSMQRAGTIALTPGESRANGMTVSPATAAA